MSHYAYSDDETSPDFQGMTNLHEESVQSFVAHQIAPEQMEALRVIVEERGGRVVGNLEDVEIRNRFGSLCGTMVVLVPASSLIIRPPNWMNNHSSSTTVLVRALPQKHDESHRKTNNRNSDKIKPLKRQQNFSKKARSRQFRQNFQSGR